MVYNCDLVDRLLPGLPMYALALIMGVAQCEKSNAEKVRADHCFQNPRTMHAMLERVVSKYGDLDSIYVRMPRADGTTEVIGIDAARMPIPDSLDAGEYIGGLKARADMHGPITMTMCSDTAVTNYARGLTYTR